MPENHEVAPISLSDLKSLLDEQKLSKNKDRIQSYEIMLITPMFGGGIQPGTVNKEHPVRSSSVRGHLRFWWRATRGAESCSVDELRRKEVAIFGDTSNPSRVKIWVNPPHEELKLSDPKELNRKKKPVFKSGFPSYALFGFDGPVEYLQSYRFTLHIEFEEIRSNDSEALTVEQLKSEINTAVWAWVNFGGIGSRTRRGSGSLFCKELAPKKGANISEWFQKELQDRELQLLPLGEFRDWPTLCNKIHIVKSDQSSDPTRVWNNLIKKYQEFRQKGEEPTKQNVPRSRSYWPEPDSIRHITKMAENGHEQTKTIQAPTYAFPRAQLGMPINFQFNQDSQLKKQRDKFREPYDTILTPKGKDRLASPLILKALAYEQNLSVGAIVILNQKPIDELELKLPTKEKHSHIQTVRASLAANKITRNHIYGLLDYKNSPMRLKDEKPTQSAIEAFLASTEV